MVKGEGEGAVSSSRLTGERGARVGGGGRFDKETVDAHKAVEAMLKAHPWIKTERQLFGKPGANS